MNIVTPGDQVTATAARYDFGASVRGWTTLTWANVRNPLIVGVVLVAIGGGLVLFGWNRDNDGLKLFCWVIGAICLVQSVYALVRFLSRIPRVGAQVFCFERGLVTARWGTVRKVASFPDATVTEGRTRILNPGGRLKRISIELKVASPLGTYVLGGLPDFVTEASEVIARTAASAQIEPMLATLRHGGTLDFGTARLTAQQVIVDDSAPIPQQSLSWFRVEEGTWKLGHGDIVTGQVSGSVNHTTNFRAFSAIVSGMTGG